MQFFNHIPTVNAYDTEAYSNILKVICDAYGNYYEPDNTPDSLLDWLFKTSCDLNFLYNIDYDLAILFHAIKPDVNPDNNGMYSYKNYTIGYLSGKSMKITKHINKTTAKTIRLYDISQFYKTDKFQNLDKVAKEVLGIGKNNEELEISRKEIGETQGYYEAHRELIIKYCKNDAYITMLLAKKKIQSLVPLLEGQIPKSFNSLASISKSYLSLRHTTLKNIYFKLLSKNFDTFRDISKAHNTIFQTYFGGIFYLHSLGKYGLSYEYDLNSAYPYAITQLYSLENATISYSTTYKQADYSFWHVKIKNMSDLPIHYRTGDTEITYIKSNNYVENWFTGAEIDYFKQHHNKDIDIQVIDGYTIDTTKQLEFEDFNELYNTRNKIKQSMKQKKAMKLPYLEEDMLQWSYKTVLNATYGCFAENQHGMTQYSNFIYASYITAMTRIKIYEIIDRIGFKHVKAVMTDAVITDIPIDDPEFNSKDLGKFKFEGKFDNCTMYMNGIYITEVKNKSTSNQIIEDTKAHIILHNRGFPTLIDKDTLINATGTKLNITRNMKLIKIKEGIIQHKQSEIGKFTTQTKYLDLEANKRKYSLDTDKLNFEYLKDNELQTDYLYNTELQFKYNYKSFIKQIDWKDFTSHFRKSLQVKPTKRYNVQEDHLDKLLTILDGKNINRDIERFNAGNKKKLYSFIIGEMTLQILKYLHKLKNSLT